MLCPLTDKVEFLDQGLLCVTVLFGSASHLSGCHSDAKTHSSGPWHIHSFDLVVQCTKTIEKGSSEETSSQKLSQR